MALTLYYISDSKKYLSGNDIFVVVRSDSFDNKTDYRLLLQVISVDGLLYGSPFDPDEISLPSGHSEVIFNISGIVDQFFERSFQWPLVGAVTGYSNLAYDIHLKPGESYIDDITNEKVTNWGDQSGPYFIIKGKLTTYEIATLNSKNSSFHDWYIAGGRWLSRLPLSQVVAPHQPVKLWWCPPATQSAGVVINVKGYYDDNSTDTKTNSIGLYADAVTEFDVQPAHVGLATIKSGSKLKYYEVWLSGNATVEKRTFVLDWEYYENNYFLFVDNRMGGVECLWLHGAVTFSPEGEGTVSSRPLPMEAGYKVPTLIGSSESNQDKWIINSGYHPPDEMRAWKMLLDKPQAWLAIPPDGGTTDLSLYTIVPVIIENKKLELFDSLKELISVELELSEAH